jgi:hypothetical protein
LFGLIVGGMVMKKGLILFVALLIVATFAALGNAQGLFWPGSALGFGGNRGPCDPCTAPFFEPPAFYIGWMESTRRASWSFDSADPGSFFGGQHKWNVAGLWLGLEQKINLTCDLGVDLDGWLLIPSNRPGDEGEGALRSVVIGVGTNAVTVQLPGLGSRTWNTRTDWWYLDAEANYAFCTPLKGLAGFRYEHFSTRWDNPSTDSLPSTPDDTADITINSYLPYVGLRTSVGGPGGNVSVKFIGFPWAPGDVSHFETGEAGNSTRVQSTGNWDRSYFWELFAEYNRNFSSSMGLGAFFRWNVFHGHGNLSTDVLPALGSVSRGAAFDRNTVTFGGSVSLNFGSPF